MDTPPVQHQCAEQLLGERWSMIRRPSVASYPLRV